MRSVYTGITLILLLLLVTSVCAVPTTRAATAINSSSLLFNCSGAISPVVWKYGTASGNLPWLSENQTTITGGIANLTERGVPLMAGTTFYYQACDPTGCGSELSSTLPVVTVAPTTTFGVLSQNITKSHFDLAIIGANILEPYTWVTANPNITFGVLLFFVFTGLWLRQREVVLPIILGMIAAGLLLYQGTNSVGIPPEMLIIVIGLVTVGLTGVVMSLFKR